MPCSSCGSSLVSLEVICPAQILLAVQNTAIRHSNFYFSSFYNPLFWNLEICFHLFLYLFFPVFFSALYLIHPSILFYLSFCSLFCFLPLCLLTLSSNISDCCLFKSAILSFLSSYNSVLSASPLLLFNLLSFC